MLCFSNQNENSKLKILIWDTPSLPIGTYLAISTGSGFIFSYIITTSIATIYNSNKPSDIQYKYVKPNEENHEQFIITRPPIGLGITYTPNNNFKFTLWDDKNSAYVIEDYRISNEWYHLCMTP